MMSQQATVNTKMLFLIRRREHATRDALIAHWYKNHMPAVIAAQSSAKSRGFNHATRYWATLFQDDPKSRWDGVAQLWFESPMPYPQMPFGTQPSDSFQEHAAPYNAWETSETVLFDHLPAPEGLTLNEAYPTTRTRVHRTTVLIPSETERLDLNALNEWLEQNTSHFGSRAQGSGCLRCAVSLSTEFDRDPYLALIEFYFAAADDWQNYSADVGDAFIQALLVAEETEIYFSDTELIGIP